MTSFLKCESIFFFCAICYHRTKMIFIFIRLRNSHQFLNVIRWNNDGLILIINDPKSTTEILRNKLSCAMLFSSFFHLSSYFIFLSNLHRDNFSPLVGEYKGNWMLLSHAWTWCLTHVFHSSEIRKIWWYLTSHGSESSWLL